MHASYVTSNSGDAVPCPPVPQSWLCAVFGKETAGVVASSRKRPPWSGGKEGAKTGRKASGPHHCSNADGDLSIPAQPSGTREPTPCLETAK